MNIEKVVVGLGPRAYDIIIGDGVLDAAGGLVAPHLKRPRTVVVTDENVHAAHGQRFLAALDAASISHDCIVLPPGEGSKSFASLERLVGELLALGVDRNDLVIAFGGGVIGDLTGFAAAILKRGCRFAQVPTSLLAQVDSAVGGKTAVNTPQGKNLVGAFHQPALVLADVGALDTLPPRQLRAGYAEIVKYGALGDPSYFAWLEAHGAELLGGDKTARIAAVKRACEMKAAIVAADERETGARALLNLGHTFGHALEAALGYGDALLHGEAVAAGMGLAFDYSVREGVCAAGDAGRLKAHLKTCGLPAGIEDIDAARDITPAQLLELMRQDKKVKAGALTLILARAIGEAYIAENVDQNAILGFLERKTNIRTGANRNAK